MGGFSSLWVLYLLAVVRTSGLETSGCIKLRGNVWEVTTTAVPPSHLWFLLYLLLRFTCFGSGVYWSSKVTMHVFVCAFAPQLQFSDPTPTKATLEIWSGKNFWSFNRLLFVLVHSAALHSRGWKDRCPGVRSRTARNQRANRLVMISNETTAPFDIIFSACLLFYFSEGTSSKNSASFEIKQVTPTHAWKSTLDWDFLIFERCLNVRVYSVIFFFWL